MQNKRGISLPVNFLILIIIAILIFGLSLGIFFKIRGGLKEITISIDRQTEAELRRLLQQELAVVAIPFPIQKVRVGQQASFWIGIRNIELGTLTFVVGIWPSHIAHPDFTITRLDETAKKAVSEQWLGGFALQDTTEVEPQESTSLPLPIKTKRTILLPGGLEDIDLSKGDQVVFNVCVTRGSLADQGLWIGNRNEGAFGCDTERDPQDPPTKRTYDRKIHQVTVIIE